MYKLNLTILIFYSSVLSCFGQSNHHELNGIPTERVYLHTNSNFLFAGEYLHYQFYNILPTAKRLSSISKIGYVDLINEERNAVFHHKLRLTNGVCSSEYFVPSDLPSGNYKLVGYTNWMLNFPPEILFQKDITILNPYLSNQEVFLKDSSSISKVSESIRNKTTTLSKETKISIEIQKDTFNKREKVKLELIVPISIDMSGNYSLSVRKTLPFPTAGQIEIVDTDQYSSQWQNIKNGEYLPETKGFLISGKLYHPIKEKRGNQKILLSFPGDHGTFRTATTDTSGAFTTQLTIDYNGEKFFAHSIDSSEIKLEAHGKIDYGNEPFHNFVLSETMADFIRERSIQNQIENAYFENRPDSILQSKSPKPFYDGEILTYELDDYTRFSTFKETVVEILEHVWIDKDKNGNQMFKVRYYQPLLDSGEQPLVFLDGVYIHNHGKLLAIPSKSIKSINVGRDQYLYGSLSFQGIIDIATFRGDAFDNYLDKSTKAFVFEPSRPKKKYYKEDYSGILFEQKKRLPDFRNQLLWQPEIEVERTGHEIEFFTSDVTGEFVITLEGITKNGRPVTLHKHFTVN